MFPATQVACVRLRLPSIIVAIDANGGKIILGGTCEVDDDIVHFVRQTINGNGKTCCLVTTKIPLQKRIGGILVP